MLYLQTNPGKVIIGYLKSSEVAFVEHLVGLPYEEGDILYYDGSNLNRLSIGTDGQVLTVSSGLPIWAAGGGGGGQVDSVVGGTGIDVNATDPVNPTVNLDSATVASLGLADSALQSGDNISLLNNDAGYTTNVGTVTSVSGGTGLTGSVTSSGSISLNSASSSS